MYKDARPAGTAYGLVYMRATQGTFLSHTHTPLQDPQFRSQTISTTEWILCRMDVEVSIEVSRSLLTPVHIMYLLFFLFQNYFKVIIIKINLTKNYQLLLYCNKVHRATVAIMIWNLKSHKCVINLLSNWIQVSQRRHGYLICSQSNHASYECWTSTILRW
jgi:hypothetical protein